jgi:hypothetical protein
MLLKDPDGNPVAEWQQGFFVFWPTPRPDLQGRLLVGRGLSRGKVMITMFSLFAEIERDLISERTKEGLARAKAQGKVLGRPKGSLGKSMLDGKEKEIKILLDKRVSKASIAKIYGVSWAAADNFIRTRKLR